MKRAAAAVLVVLALLAAGCGDDQNAGTQAGIITAKVHEPFRQWTAIFFVPVTTGKTTTLIPIPYVMTDDEDWRIDIKGATTTNRLGQVVTARGHAYLSRDEWETLAVGQEYPGDPTGQAKDDITKRKSG